MRRLALLLALLAPVPLFLQGSGIYGRPSRQLVLRSAATIGKKELK